MTRHDGRNTDETPDTALEEVLHEAEEAATRVTDPEERRRGEAGDAITPAEQAQKESHHD
ncbi:hypothetical protein P1P68_31990 [Streptomyces scabiei]|uniref:hypothetical protein n=1 Tax=Streptomyces scabiei TaxID=1930 RepID=UPI00298F8122|nr:hypothetical protein [Streptomyces scabiei]MDW8809298.1 hypothetical protein [Streptomyces scabiei]